MKYILAATAVAITYIGQTFGALTQTFEEDESAYLWGNTGWNGLNEHSRTFLNIATGGYKAGRSTHQQQYSRSFRTNRAGVDVTKNYSSSMWLKISPPERKTNFDFRVYDGNFGSERAAALRVNSDLEWQVGFGGDTWRNVGLEMKDNYLYKVIFNIDVDNKKYDVIIAEYTSDLSLRKVVRSNGNNSGRNVFTNRNNGKLGFYLLRQEKPSFRVDNIKIKQGFQAVPEPSSALLMGIGCILLVSRRKR